ncbi:hypothetical protein B6U74_04140 [Candidatus Bathyarchaeota archaeon ex4484_205]|nr:MAG: hypothetical protein B6U74_04140 [Candidatus Bathyarchaeota archaeon ex4484_205]
MLKGWRVIAKKELKQLLRDPKITIGMIIIPLIMYPLMGSLFRASIETSMRQEIKIALVDEDRGEFSTYLKQYLGTLPNIKLTEYDCSLSEAIKRAWVEEMEALIYVPPGASESLERVEPIELEIYGRVEVSGFSSTVTSGVLSGYLASFSEFLSQSILHKKLPEYDPFVILNPLTLDYSSIISGEVVKVRPETVTQFSMNQAITIPTILMILMTFATSIAATSIGLEKEEKTLETLLSMPIDRMAILFGKLLGSIFIAMIGAISFFFGFRYYMESFTFGETLSPEEMSSLGVYGDPVGYILLIISMFLALSSAIAIAISISIFASDVRSAQATVSYLMPLFFIPGFITMFIDPSTLPIYLQIILYAIPFVHPMLATKTLFTHNYLPTILGLIYVAAFTFLVLYIAAKFFKGEKILTARFGFKLSRFKRRG